jgi:hypothetical protein
MDLRNCNWVGSEITSIKIHIIIYESRKFHIGKCGDKKFDVYIRKTKLESNIYVCKLKECFSSVRSYCLLDENIKFPSIVDSLSIQPIVLLKRLRWSRSSVLAFGTQVCGFAPGRSRRIFRAKKSSARLPSEKKLSRWSHVVALRHVKDS